MDQRAVRIFLVIYGVSLGVLIAPMSHDDSTMLRFFLGFFGVYIVGVIVTIVVNIIVAKKEEKKS